ncbi:MAG: hypothetical protein AAF942_03795, partial [Pseudomonadota bacterium]
MHILRRILALLFRVGALGGLFFGNARPVEHRPLSKAEFEKADFSSLELERYWGDAAPDQLEQFLKRLTPLLEARFPEAVDATPTSAPLLNHLVVSGG